MLLAIALGLMGDVPEDRINKNPRGSPGNANLLIDDV